MNAQSEGTEDAQMPAHREPERYAAVEFLARVAGEAARQSSVTIGRRELRPELTAYGGLSLNQSAEEMLHSLLQLAATQDQVTKEILRRQQELKEKLLVQYVATLPRVEEPPNEDVAAGKDTEAAPTHNPLKPDSVELSLLLKRGSQIGAAIFILSLLSWLYLDVPMINPYLSVLGLFASPFFFAMGKAIAPLTYPLLFVVGQ